MQAIESLLSTVSSFVWGPVMLAFLMGVGVYLTILLKALPWRKLVHAVYTLFESRSDTQSKGDITGFQALMTALSATVGTGNIAGVATAIALGGPGAVFWMWVMALFGMATKYSEAVLAVHYREIDDRGNHIGGPMYYIRKGMGKNWGWLAFLFALFGMLASFGIGNTIQSNSVALAVAENFSIPNWVTGLVMAVLAGMVIIGGVRRIGKVAEKLVPIMAILYILGSMIVIGSNLEGVPAAFMTIIHDAFSGTAAAGGFAGASVWMAIRFGVARGVFSNEAGLGSAAMAHAAAKTSNPVKQGTIAMLGTFIDTILICTMTALVIVLTGAWTGGETSSALSTLAYNTGLPGFGSYVVTLGLIVFAFTTILGWSYYGERCAEYIFGTKSIMPFRLLWIIAIPLGALAAGENSSVKLLWLLADVLNGLMAIPNLIALVVLSPVVYRLTKDYYSNSETKTNNANK
ncbi:MAG: sodium:alanine symporter family protein [Thiotrichaceae bacterium]